jgi:glutaminase
MKTIDYQAILDAIAAELAGFEDAGQVASYIPELGRVNPDKFGVHLTTVEGEHFCLGDSDERFSTQSVSKVLSLALALRLAGEKVWERVGVEPSGSAFNSLVQLEYEKGIPRNPLINAGAIVVCDVLMECLKAPKRELLAFVREVSGSPDIDYDPTVAQSEKRTGFGNYALANLMKAFGNIRHDVDAVLDLYFHLCSIGMSCRELARTFLFLAADGTNPVVRAPVVSPLRAKRINAIMQMCGFYDEAGEFAFRVGLPGKSGVGGGIVAVYPGRYSVAVLSPRLNAKGNSCKGMMVLEALTTRTKQSIF